MSQYENEHNGQGQSGQGTPRQQGGANPYAAQHQQQQQGPDLDAGAPLLRSNDIRRTNRNAMLMLGALALLLVLAVMWVMFAGSGHKDAPKPQKEETVNVPEAPKALPMLPTPAPLPQRMVQQVQPIPVAPPLPPPSRNTQPSGPREPSLVERRIAAAQGGSSSGAFDAPAPTPTPGYGNGAPGMPGMGSGGLPGMPDGLGQFRMPANSNYGSANKSADTAAMAQPLIHPDNLLMRGTYIRCVLETHIVTDIPGFTSCIVTEPVYSFNGQHLLLPKGSKVLGSYGQEPNGPRVAVVWDRVVTPTGIDVTMASPGVDNLGGAGHPGYYDAHWPSRISSALLISMLSDAFKYEAAKHGPTTNTVSANGTVVQEPFESNTAQTVQELADQAVRRAANRPATVTINQGTVVTIYVAKDVDFTGVLARY